MRRSTQGTGQRAGRAAGVFSKPVYFLTKDVSFLGFTRPEYYLTSGQEPKHPYVQTVPGLAFAGVISFPTSTAAHEMR